MGVEVTRFKKGIHICQMRYAFDILKEIGMIASKSCFTPLIFNNKIVF